MSWAWREVGEKPSSLQAQGVCKLAAASVKNPSEGPPVRGSCQLQMVSHLKLKGGLFPAYTCEVCAYSQLLLKSGLLTRSSCEHAYILQVKGGVKTVLPALTMPPSTSGSQWDPSGPNDYDSGPFGFEQWIGRDATQFLVGICLPQALLLIFPSLATTAKVTSVTKSHYQRGQWQGPARGMESRKEKLSIIVIFLFLSSVWILIPALPHPHEWM